MQVNYVIKLLKKGECIINKKKKFDLHLNQISFFIIDFLYHD